MRRNLFRRLSANTLRRRIPGDKLGIFMLELLELTHELVEFEVRNKRLVEHVIAVLVFANLLAELLDAVVYGVFPATHASADFTASASARGWRGIPCRASTRAICPHQPLAGRPQIMPRRREPRLSCPIRIVFIRRLVVPICGVFAIIFDG